MRIKNGNKTNKLTRVNLWNGNAPFCLFNVCVKLQRKI